MAPVVKVDLLMSLSVDQCLRAVVVLIDLDDPRTFRIVATSTKTEDARKRREPRNVESKEDEDQGQRG